MTDTRPVVWIFSMSLFTAGLALELDQCEHALGMEKFTIPDSALTASSSFDEDVGPINARVRNELGGGAWCPKQDNSDGIYEYLQIDLGEQKVITMVETQGRFIGGQGQEFANRYKLEYQREDGGKWFMFRNREGKEIVDGNTNTYSSVMQALDPPIIGRRIRFVPQNLFSTKACMRVEIYGCIWTDHLLSYDMPQGQQKGRVRGNNLELIDWIYDGDIRNQYLSSGLGQLTDGVTGEHDFRLSPIFADEKKGYDWVGWQNNTSGVVKPLTINFRFDSVRNFTSLWLHCNNMYEKDIRVFRLVKMYFSIGGTYYTEPASEFHYTRDTGTKTARYIIIPLSNPIAQFVKIELYFDDRWLLISEVHFVSDLAVGIMDNEVDPVLNNKIPNVKYYPVQDYEDDINNNNNNNKNKNPHNSGADKSDSGVNQDDQETYIVNNNNNNKRSKKMKEEVIGMIIGVLVILIALFIIIFIVICLKNKRQKYHTNHSVMKRMTSYPNSYHADDVIIGMTNGKPGNGYNMVTSYDLESDRDSPAAVCYNLTNSDFLINGELQNRKLPEVPLMKTPESTLSGAPQHYASSSLLSIQGVTGNNVYAAPQNLDFMWRDNIHVMEFPRENLKPIEKLGEGQFGEVQLCEATGLADLIGDDFLVNRLSSKSMLVAVKMLRANADHQAMLDFNKELKMMCQLRDPNIVQVLGVCSTTAPLAVIVEYMKYGDLYQYLQKHDLDGGSSLHRNSSLISYGCLVYMATQIASGMKYLETLNMVHRDLAARNCLVGAHYTIKISDFGMSRSLYSNDYYRIEGKAVLPIRWMAWESVLLGKFSTKSDVWSFGVTMWEILNFARHQPLQNLSDDDVIENCTHYFQNDGQEICLSQPLYCPKEIYDMIKECWNKDNHLRPTFREIHMFLQRKNMGYNPREDISMSAFATLPASFI